MSNEEPKPCWKSKTIWTNLIVLIALLIQTQTGFVIGATEQMALLTVINIVLRIVTKESVNWFPDNQ